jgi:hypothetical protein
VQAGTWQPRAARREQLKRSPAVQPLIRPTEAILMNPRSVVLEYFNGPACQLERLLRLSLVTCPVALFPATSDSEKISFNQINKNTDHRIKYLKVDADTARKFQTRAS